MTAWLLAHDRAIQVLAAVPLLVWAGLAYWWSRDRPSLRDLGLMSTRWLQSKDRHREVPPR